MPVKACCSRSKTLSCYFMFIRKPPHFEDAPQNTFQHQPPGSMDFDDLPPCQQLYRHQAVPVHHGMICSGPQTTQPSTSFLLLRWQHWFVAMRWKRCHGASLQQLPSPFSSPLCLNTPSLLPGYGDGSKPIKRKLGGWTSICQLS